MEPSDVQHTSVGVPDKEFCHGTVCKRRPREFVSVGGGLLLEEVGYPLGVRRFEKDLRSL